MFKLLIWSLSSYNTKEYPPEILKPALKYCTLVVSDIRFDKIPFDERFLEYNLLVLEGEFP